MDRFRIESKRELMSSKELASHFNVPLNTVYYWVSKNEIPYFKAGKHIRFDFNEVIEHFKQKTQRHNKYKENG